MNNIIEETRVFVTDLLIEKLTEDFYFHSLKHTQQTVNAVLEICEYSSLEEKEKEVLTIAAWFHDTGYTVDYKNHEQKSIEIAEEFLTSKNYPPEDIQTIKQLILKTTLGEIPETNLEKILKDADLAHLAKKSGLKRGELFRKEINAICKKSFSDKEWLEIDKNFYEKAQYFSDYAKENWQPKIASNLKRINKKLDELESGVAPKKQKESALSPKDLKKLDRIKSSERGVETVFRTTSRNHLSLSSMADSKANTLISISALIISIILSFLIENLDVQRFLLVPVGILLLVCVLTIVFATLSTRPKVTKLGLTRSDIENRRGNLLFFGNFYTMPLEDYEFGMKELMEDRDYLYSNLIRDIYFLGLVLNKKYRFLSVAYNVFMFGIIISVLAFLVTMYLN